MIDTAGRPLEHRTFAAMVRGYTDLLAWVRSFGLLVVIGIESAGAYGAGLARHLQPVGSAWSRSTDPTASPARFAGKSDPFDAEAAARARR